MKKHIGLTVLTALILILGNIAAVQAKMTPPHGVGQIGLQAVVLCEELTVRQKPDVSSKAAKKLKYGTTIIVTQQKGKWAECVLSDSVDEEIAGWVNADYIAIDPAWYRTEDKTQVYAWGDTKAPKVALLDKGTTLPVLKEEGDWFVVSLRGAAGWIHKSESD